VSERDFPAGFLWGSSTAAHQVEGGNVANDWWAWEHLPGSTATEPSGDAIDHYHRYDADFALLASLGHNAHRFSIEWSRVEPEPGQWSAAALDHYRRVLTSLHTHGLTPFVTLMHFTVPHWVDARGAWLAPDAVDRFGDFCSRVVDALGDLVPWFCTINEPQIVALFGYLAGYHPPGRQNPLSWRRVTRTLRLAHERALDVIAAGPGQAQAGISLQLPALEPARPDDPSCVAAYEELERMMAGAYLDGLRGDFVGVQYYTRMRVDPALPGLFARPPAGVPLTAMGWELHPDGFRQTLHKAARSGLPIVVTENGIATDDDTERVAYLASHLGAVKQAMDEGVDVRGYHYWSSFDNFEWAEGYRPRFGLVGIDRAHGLARMPRLSAHAYGRLACSGQLAALTDP
jgi:beta-glucosidase